MSESDRAFRASGRASLNHRGRRSCISMRSRAKVVSHTKMQVSQPWCSGFETNWHVPNTALSGTLLRQGGQYVAALEWESAADCAAWLAQPGMEETRDSTTQYEVCNSLTDAPPAESRHVLPNAVPTVVGNAISGTIRSRADLDALNHIPDVDPSVVFSISAGEEVDIDESDEVLVSGGDPSFLDEKRWSAHKPPQSQVQTFNTDSHDDDEEDEEDVLFHGGDPTFLDDSMWDDATPPEAEEWDGKEDDTAHLFD